MSSSPYPNELFFVVPFLDSIFDLVTLSLIAGILLLSLLSICFIFYLRFKTRNSPLLQNFNSLWAVRFLLVTLISFWAFNELIRLPFFRRSYLSPFSPPLTLSQQTHLCKINVVLSLGFFEPGFLIVLLFLVKVSIKKRNCHSNNNILSVGSFVAAACFPILFLQILVVFFYPELHLPLLPEYFHRIAIVTRVNSENEAVSCGYPLLSSIIFAAFGIGYALGFMLSCYKAVSVVINKGLRIRICTLACAVLVSLPVQIILLGLSAFLGPEVTTHGGAGLVIFLAVLTCAVVGEGLLVLSPIADTLSAGGNYWRNGSPSLEDGKIQRLLSSR